MPAESAAFLTIGFAWGLKDRFLRVLNLCVRRISMVGLFCTMVSGLSTTSLTGCKISSINPLLRRTRALTVPIDPFVQPVACPTLSAKMTMHVNALLNDFFDLATSYSEENMEQLVEVLTKENLAQYDWLNSIVVRHEATLRKHLMGRALPLRTSMLLEVWSNMSTMRCAAIIDGICICPSPY
jgi:hypothetical protein